MNRFLYSISLLTLATLRLEADSSETKNSDRSWKEIALSRIERVAENPTQESILSLSGYLRVALRKPENMEPRHHEVVAAAREVVLSDPKHFDYVMNEIETTRAEWKRTGNPFSFDQTRSKVISTLSVLPSPESIRVLGSLLTDTEDTNTPGVAGSGLVSNAVMSQEALIELLENPPTSNTHLPQLRANIPTWQLWFEQVKAGNRTFRFKGDPQPYTLAGPADESLDPSLDRTVRIRDAPPTGSRDGSGEEGGNGDESPSRLPLFLLAAFLPAAGVAWLILRRKGASGA